jgi:hypothetical protein
MKGLRGLFLNNAHLLKRNTAFYLGTWLVLLAVQSLSHFRIIAEVYIYGFLFLATVVMIPAVSLEVVGHALSNRWDVFQKAMPVRKGLIVFANYATYMLLSAATLGIWFLLPFENGDATNIITTMLFVQFTAIAYYPMTYLLYALSPQRESTGQVLLIVAFGIAFAGGNIFVRFAYDYNILVTSVVAAVVLYVISIILSIHLDGLSRKGIRQKVSSAKAKSAMQ